MVYIVLGENFVLANPMASKKLIKDAQALKVYARSFLDFLPYALVNI